MLIRGTELTPAQRAEVLRVFVYRWTVENARRGEAYGYCPHCQTPGGRPSPDNVACRQVHPTVPLETDAEWIASHAFHITARGTLAPGQHAEPVYVAD